MNQRFIGACALAIISFLGEAAAEQSTSTPAQPKIFVDKGLLVWDSVEKETITLDSKAYKSWAVNTQAGEAILLRAEIEKNWVSPPTLGICTVAQMSKFLSSRELRGACPWSTMSSTSDAIAIVAKSSGLYTAVIQNGRYAKQTVIDSAVEVRRPFAQSGMRNYPNGFAGLDEALHELFNGFEFSWAISSCSGESNAFYSPSDKSITLCTPFVKTLEERKLGSEALLFVLCHEIGHGLLDQWGLPGADNEELADELGAIMLLEFADGDPAIISQAVEFWRLEANDQGDLVEFLARNADTHAPAVQRARKLAVIADGYSYYGRRWAKQVYPFLTTTKLQARANSGAAFADADFARELLASRSADELKFAQAGAAGGGESGALAAPGNDEALLSSIMDPARRAAIAAQPLLVALISDYYNSVGAPDAFFVAVNTGAPICLSACREKAAPGVELGSEITASDFVRMILSTRFGHDETPDRRWAALARIDAVIASLGAGAIPLSSEDKAYFVNEFAGIVAKSRTLSGREYPNIDALIKTAAGR